MTISVQDRAMNAAHEPRNPFGVMDVPDPFGADVTAFAASAKLEGSAGDANAQQWARLNGAIGTTIDGPWSSRWNGGADPTIAGDVPDKWKQGNGEACTVSERFYLRFDWDDGRRQGLIEAKREGDCLVGKYINLSNPQITRPWIGLVVDERRIDGRWTQGRLDFRR